jgi:hypothetical protein
MVGGSFQVLWLPPPLKLVTMILLKVALSTKNQIKYKAWLFFSKNYFEANVMAFSV